jgi:hypothetical protein
MRWLWFALALALAFVLAFSSAAFARASSDVPYSVADAYSTALRFVRVDKGCKLVDKDPDAAFVTFECKDDDKTKRGSVEIFRQGRDGARVQIALGDDPHYVELRWLELLERKLKEERGTPPPIAPPPAHRPDAGTP